MKSLVLVLPVAALCVAVVTWLLRTWVVRHRAVLMTCVWLCTLPIFVIEHQLMPADLWFLPASLTEPRSLVDLGFGVVVYTAIFFGGILQLYNLADRGLSLRILIDIDEARRPLTVEEIMGTYSAGRGFRWMYAKRLEGLRSQRLIRIKDGRVTATATGRRTAALFDGLRVFLRLE